MIRIMWTSLLIGLTGGGLMAGSAWAQPAELPAQVVTLGGPAEIHKKGARTWGPAALRDEVDAGDSVRTQVSGRVTLKTASGQALRLGSRSQAVMLAPESETSPTRVRLDNGWLWVAVSPNSPPPSQVEVRAGSGVVTVRGAGVGFRRGPDGSVLVQVHHGSAVCAGPEKQWERTLAGAQELLIPASGTPGVPGPLIVDKLEMTWVKWNVDQDFAGGYGGATRAP